MKYDFLKHLNKTELIELESIILGKSDNQELLDRISSLNKTSISLSGNFDSSYMSYYDKELEDRCDKVLKQLKTNDLFFFLNSFHNKGNTKYSHIYGALPFYEKLENKVVLDDLTILLNIVYSVYQYYNSDFKTKPTLNLNRVNNIFKLNLFQYDFEGPYNMLNYIKNYIYYLLKQEKEITTKEVFSDYLEKRKLVTIQIRSISSYLCEIRNGTNLRLCIANAGLSKTANKTGEQFNVQQSLFIDALAFGTTLEKIENGDYEDYKKLLYLPKGKELNK